MVATLRLRERKKESTRQALVEAAWALFRNKGYASTTVEEIAAAARISKRTFFRYFPAKEAIVFHRSEERLALLRAALASGGRGVPAVRAACLEVARSFVDRREEVVEQYRLVEATPALATTEGEINRQWIAAIAATLVIRRSEAAERRARILAGAIFGAMRATLIEWVARGGQPDLVRMGSEVFSLLEKTAA